MAHEENVNMMVSNLFRSFYACRCKTASLLQAKNGAEKAADEIDTVFRRYFGMLRQTLDEYTKTHPIEAKEAYRRFEYLRKLTLDNHHSPN